MSVVTAVIQDRFHKDTIPQVWDELRRKIADVRPQLPPSVRGKTMVIDDFGDVYGIFLAITGEGYSFPELRRYAEFLRRELLLVQNVKKVELFAAQSEVVFLEISRQRLRVRPQRGANLQPPPGEERRRRRRPRARGRSAPRSRSARRFPLGR